MSPKRWRCGPLAGRATVGKVYRQLVRPERSSQFCLGRGCSGGCDAKEGRLTPRATSGTGCCQTAPTLRSRGRGSKTFLQAILRPNHPQASLQGEVPPPTPRRAEANCGDSGCGGRLTGQAPRVPRPARHVPPIHLPRHVRRPRHQSDGLGGQATGRIGCSRPRGIQTPPQERTLASWRIAPSDTDWRSFEFWRLHQDLPLDLLRSWIEAEQDVACGNTMHHDCGEHREYWYLDL